MAFFEVNFFSPTLCFHTDINVFIPTPNSDELMNHKRSNYFAAGARFQVLYLLHGAYGDCSDWMRLTSIEKYAQEHKLAVVMPSASNSFYQDMEFGSAYLTYLTQELPELVASLFPVSREREHTFTAGLSMGGYGAWKLALQCPERYAACASLSGALDIAQVRRETQSGSINGPFDWQALFSGRDPAGTEADLFTLLEKHRAAGTPLPRLFMSCGTEDFIYPVNEGAHERLVAMGVEHVYERHPGIHDWDYWDKHIQRALDWLPLRNDSIRE